VNPLPTQPWVKTAEALAIFTSCASLFSLTVGLLEKREGQGEVLQGRALGYIGHVVERG
jgi:hypothetical protein